MREKKRETERKDEGRKEKVMQEERKWVYCSKTSEKNGTKGTKRLQREGVNEGI